MEHYKCMSRIFFFLVLLLERDYSYLSNLTMYVKKFFNIKSFTFFECESRIPIVSIVKHACHDRNDSLSSTYTLHRLALPVIWWKIARVRKRVTHDKHHISYVLRKERLGRWTRERAAA